MAAERLVNVQVRAGMIKGVTNPVLGFWAGPGKTKGRHVIRLSTTIYANFFSIQLIGTSMILHVNGLALNERPSYDYGKAYFWHLFRRKDRKSSHQSTLNLPFRIQLYGGFVFSFFVYFSL